ncbi:MAG TPA: hypothetical protein VH394_22000, partial [Thermoanaerobaculia bacterium]|nr:hypothetical protein [Thermoanaerobaculia bacterium]
MNRCAKLLLLACLLAAPVRAAEYDECDAGFIAFLGADAYQFSPVHPGDLGKVRLYTVLSHQRAAAFGDYGSALWRLEIRNEAGELVRVANGKARIDDSGQAVADFT